MSRVESATRLFFSALGKMAPEAEAKAGERLTAESWSRWTESAAKKTLPEIESASRTVLSEAPNLPVLSKAELTHVLKSRRINYTDKPAELAAFGHVKTGFLTGPGGQTIPIVERTMTPAKALTEAKAASVAELMQFTNFTPVTVLRGPGVVVQQRMGLSLEDWATKVDQRLLGAASEWNFTHTPSGFKEYLKQNPYFKNQLEQTQVQRSILGDFDSTQANIGLGMQGRRTLAGNLDMNQSFELIAKPSAPNIVSLQRAPISNKTLGYVDRFANYLRSADGKDAVARIGVNGDELHFMQMRADWFLRFKQLGPM